MNIGLVNCEEGEDSYTHDLCTAFDIISYPRILYLEGDTYYRHKGERTISDIEMFVF